MAITIYSFHSFNTYIRRNIFMIAYNFIFLYILFPRIIKKIWHEFFQWEHLLNWTDRWMPGIFIPPTMHNIIKTVLSLPHFYHLITLNMIEKKIQIFNKKSRIKKDLNIKDKFCWTYGLSFFGHLYHCMFWLSYSDWFSPNFYFI